MLIKSAEGEHLDVILPVAAGGIVGGGLGVGYNALRKSVSDAYELAADPVRLDAKKDAILKHYARLVNKNKLSQVGAKAKTNKEIAKLLNTPRRELAYKILNKVPHSAKILGGVAGLGTTAALAKLIYDKNRAGDTFTVEQLRNPALLKEGMLRKYAADKVHLTEEEADAIRKSHENKSKLYSGLAIPGAFAAHYAQGLVNNLRQAKWNKMQALGKFKGKAKFHNIRGAGMATLFGLPVLGKIQSSEATKSRKEYENDLTQARERREWIDDKMPWNWKRHTGGEK